MSTPLYTPNSNIPNTPRVYIIGLPVLMLGLLLCLASLAYAAPNGVLNSRNIQQAELNLERKVLSNPVQDLARMSKDKKVTLYGKIIQKVGSDRYLFEDNTGSVVVKIDFNEWKRRAVYSGDSIYIKGKINRDKRGNIVVDADMIAKE